MTAFPFAPLVNPFAKQAKSLTICLSLVYWVFEVRIHGIPFLLYTDVF